MHSVHIYGRALEKKKNLSREIRKEIQFGLTSFIIYSISFGSDFLFLFHFAAERNGVPIGNPVRVIKKIKTLPKKKNVQWWYKAKLKSSYILMNSPDFKLTQMNLQTGVSIFYIFPKGLTDLLVYTKEKYKDPVIYITECGKPKVVAVFFFSKFVFICLCHTIHYLSHNLHFILF